MPVPVRTNEVTATAVMRGLAELELVKLTIAPGVFPEPRLDFGWVSVIHLVVGTRALCGNTLDRADIYDDPDVGRRHWQTFRDQRCCRCEGLSR